MIDIAVIPVAGRGTRLLPLTKSQPKEMLPVAGKPVVQYVVEELIHGGIGRMLFVTGSGKTAIENHFDINVELIEHLRQTGKEEILRDLAFEREAVEYFYVRQRRQLGLGHAVLTAEPFTRGQNFVVALGDSIIGVQAHSSIVRRMIRTFEFFETLGIKGIIAFEEVPLKDVDQYGIALPGKCVDFNVLFTAAQKCWKKATKTDLGNSVDFDADEQQLSKEIQDGTVFLLDDLIEKPSVEEAPSRLAVAARYVFAPEIFDALKKTQPGKNNEIQLTDAVRRMIQSGEKFLGIKLPISEPRFDMGNFESYYRAFVEFALADPIYGEGLRDFLTDLMKKQK